MANLAPMRCDRHLQLPLTAPVASQQRWEAYLALVERPVVALLARERLHRLAPGTFSYSSNPHHILHLEVAPTLDLTARWEGNRLEVRSTSCRLGGLGTWEGAMGFSLEASLWAQEGGLEGWARVSLHNSRAAIPGASGLAHWALERVLDRIERRVSRGLHRDALAWLEGATGVDSGNGG